MKHFPENYTSSLFNLCNEKYLSSKQFFQMHTLGYLLIAFWLLMTCSSSLSANTQNDKKKVERQINSLSKQIDKQKREYSYLNSQVTKLEKELGALTNKQHSTEKKIKAAQTRVAQADAEKTELKDQLKTQQNALAQQLQAMHTAGEQSHLRLLLLQDDPAKISRNIQYFNILNRHRAQRIKKINDTTDKLQAITALAVKERRELRGLKEELAVQHKAVGKKLASRELTLKKVNSDLSSKKKRFRRLKDQEAALQRKIDSIARAARKQREAAERQRQQQAARKRQQQQAATNKRNQKTQTARTRPAQKPAKQPQGRQVTTSRTPNRPFAKLRGKLSWPVSGRVIHNYSSKRNEKQRWKGIVIAAPGGAKVKAVAAGKVAFAGWMEGYGHLIIVEHDRNYMSLYGYNRAVFKRVGQRVKANETIAAVGNSGGRNTNALYFEVRRRTVPQNPTRWLR